MLALERFAVLFSSLFNKSETKEAAPPLEGRRLRTALLRQAEIEAVLLADSISSVISTLNMEDRVNCVETLEVQDVTQNNLDENSMNLAKSFISGMRDNLIRSEFSESEKSILEKLRISSMSEDDRKFTYTAFYNRARDLFKLRYKKDLVASAKKYFKARLAKEYEIEIPS
jgi:hypothetical protein